MVASRLLEGTWDGEPALERRSIVICNPVEMTWLLPSVVDMSLCRLYYTGHTRMGRLT